MGHPLTAPCLKSPCCVSGSCSHRRNPSGENPPERGGGRDIWKAVPVVGRRSTNPTNSGTLSQGRKGSCWALCLCRARALGGRRSCRSSLGPGQIPDRRREPRRRAAAEHELHSQKVTEITQRWMPMDVGEKHEGRWRKCQLSALWRAIARRNSARMVRRGTWTVRVKGGLGLLYGNQPPH
jgi:hypothetical protein